jgi:hypothetical protein
MWKGEDQKRPSGLTKATQLKVSKLLTLITRSGPSSPKMMFSFDITGVRLLEGHLRSPVTILRSRSTKSLLSLPHAKSKPRARDRDRRNTGVSTKRVKPVLSQLLKSEVSKIHPIKDMTTTGKHLTSRWRSTSTTKGKTWSVAPLRPKAATSPKLVTTMRWRASSKLNTTRLNTPTK